MSDTEIAHLGIESDATDSESGAGGPSLPVALYIHVPFCRSKCAYCDFTSAVRDTRWHAPYVDAVLFAAAHWDSYDLLGDVPTLYVGGGTPTVLGDELVRLVEGLRSIVTLRQGAEITVESNPETTHPRLIAALVAAGVNRFSLGVQSLDDAVLVTLGRRHTAETARNAAKVLADSGMPFSVDLICGVPGQTEASWRDSLAGAIATGAGHISVYPLTIEEGTPLAEAVDSGAMPEPDPDVAAAMMLIAEETLAQAGLVRYEVANYARPGEESRHNTTYWTGGAYLGLGPSAASMLPTPAYATIADVERWTCDSASSRTRFSATCDTSEFIRRPLDAPAEVEFLTAEEAAREDVMLGMRLSVGVPAEAVTAAGLDDVLSGLLGDGLVELASDDGDARWRVTQRGWLLGNRVFGRIWDGSE